ncbi:MAG: hypothetical protein RIM84_21020 [Alphaproteobacteria bacterium]
MSKDQQVQAVRVANVAEACEIRLRAERKAGQLLVGMDKRNGGDAMRARSVATTELNVPPTLGDLGISRDQSSKWQKLAAVPEDDFEAMVEADLPF